MTEICEQCEREYKEIAKHWSMSPSCDHPSFTEHQREIITGLLMGDGSIDRGRGGRNPKLECEMINPNYLEYIDTQFGIFGNGVSLHRTAEENAKQCRDRGFSPDAKEENYSDSYRWRSVSHPELEEFANWYSTGKKVWPDDIELTPTVLKHWYCGDGNWNNNGSRNYIIIAMSNEVNNTDKVDIMFESVGLPSPNNYDIQERSRDGGLKCNAVFTVEQSKELWSYMGEPLPDFEYKWPDNYKA